MQTSEQHVTVTVVVAVTPDEARAYDTGGWNWETAMRLAGDPDRVRFYATESGVSDDARQLGAEPGDWDDFDDPEGGQ